MGFTYAIGDIHGRVDVLDADLEKIADHRKQNGVDQATIIFLGDYVDRGKASKAVVERLVAGSQDDAKWICLRGNHEQMAVDAHDAPQSRAWLFWTQNGGLATVMSYGGGKMPKEHLDWFRALPRSHQDQYRYYVHAGIQPDVPSRQQDDAVKMWVRYKRDEETPFDKYVVHGHTPYVAGPVILETRCNLDTAAYQTGRSAIAVFDDSKAGKPVEMLTVTVGYDIEG